MATEKSVEQRIAEASSVEQIREICLQAGVRARTITRDRDGSPVLTAMPSPTQPLAAERPAEPLETGNQFQRAVRIGDTVTLLTAGSVRGLDILEHRLRGGH